MRRANKREREQSVLNNISFSLQPKPNQERRVKKLADVDFFLLQFIDSNRNRKSQKNKLVFFSSEEVGLKIGSIENDFFLLHCFEENLFFKKENVFL